MHNKLLYRGCAMSPFSGTSVSIGDEGKQHIALVLAAGSSRAAFGIMNNTRAFIAGEQVLCIILFHISVVYGLSIMGFL
jgi:hypothetical protein